MKLRQKSTCAILEIEGHYDIITASNSTGTGIERSYSVRKLFAEEQIR